MWGAIIGDIAGSAYEFNNTKDYNFKMFVDGKSEFTDDTVLTVAVAKALTVYLENDRKDDLSALAVRYMHDYGNRFPHVSWGNRFTKWLDDTKPYNSFGNGSAMRVSPVGWLAESEKEVKEFSEAVTVVSHGHTEGLKGAEAVALAIYLARKGVSRDEITARITAEYYPEIADLSYKQLNAEYGWIWKGMDGVTCQASVPEALVCFAESTDFEDTIRKSVSIGGDSDTIAAMAGAIAEAYYGVPEKYVIKAKEYLPEVLLDAINYVEERGYKGNIKL